MRKLSLFLLLSMLVLVVSITGGCSLSGGAGSQVGDILKKCVETSSRIKSYDAKIVKNKNFNTGSKGLVVDEKTTVNLNCFLDPIKIKIVSQSASNGIAVNSSRSNTKSEIYIEKPGATYNIIVNGSAVSSDYLDDIGIGIISENYINQIQLFVTNTTEVKIAGSETISGKDAYKITGTIPGDKLSVMLENFKNNLSDKYDEFSILNDKINSVSKISKNIEVTYWITKDQEYCVKLKLNLTPALINVLEQNGISTESSTELSIDIEMSNFDNVAQFELP